MSTYKEIDLALAPLLKSMPRGQGEVFILNPKGDVSSVVCLSCGAVDKMMMIKRHKPTCPWKAHFAAVELLRGILEAKPKRNPRSNPSPRVQKKATY